MSKVQSIRHTDKRANIPTEELRDFVAEDEHAPATLRYPRDPSLDPQLVWQGKDEQDAADLAVPAVPIYIQEKIHPQALINDFMAQAGRAGTGVAEEAAGYQLQLFNDFNGGPEDFAEKVEFYQHEQNWANRMILGDSLLVMASLAEKEGLRGRVQMIYLDPPYGIKFGSNWQVSTRKRDVKDGKAEDATRQPEQIRAFRDTWQLGIHSYLAYLRDRLTVARELLTESGSVFVQIGDENVHLVRCVLDEVFGSENFVSLITFQKTSYQETNYLANVCDYILWYGKDRQHTKVHQLYYNKTDGNSLRLYRYGMNDEGEVFTIPREQLEDPNLEQRGIHRFKMSDITSPGWSEIGSQPIVFKGKTYELRGNLHWKTNIEGMKRLMAQNRIVVSGNSLAFAKFLSDFSYSPISNVWTDTLTGSFAEPRVYVVQTVLRVIERCLLMTTDPGDLVLDPTCGSGTTAYVAEQWGRRWITIDTSRVALALARTRLMAAKYPYYLLADSPEGVQKEAEITGVLPPSPFERRDGGEGGDIKRGFVYKRVPHITLKSIANNPDIHERMTREEIDAAIARHADSETLYDQPYEDSKRVRVSGPFTVESLSPHRMLSLDEAQDTASALEVQRQHDFASMILDNLRKAGVQNTRKAERLTFDRLDPYAGTWLHAVGEYHEADGKPRRVAVSIGPEHGTVGPQQVKEAAKEAVQGLGFDLLIVCGFAFDPHVSEEVKRYGSLTVLPTRMNPDLAMGNELLKKTGAGNLFMVFGEPDVEIRRQPEGTLVVEIKGVDVYDPTTGQIRSASTDDIACWFIDTDYNGESFFVRHAYFTGADEPYDKLKRALRAEVDEEAWSALYSTVSRPFPAPASGKIAVKVINHYGDEVLKVFDVACH